MIYNFFEVTINDKMLEIYDTINSILFDCQCAILLIDITNQQSLEQLEKLFDVILFSEFSYLKLILVENKIDEKREISEEQINSFIEKNGIKDNMKISIKEGTGLEELANKIKEYVNKKENDIPINFGSQNLDEYKNEFKELNRNKDMKTANIIFLGNSNVGKTCLYLRLNKNFYNNKFLSTIGIDHSFKTYKYKNEIYKINLVDTAGQDRYRNLPKSYYVNASGVFLLFDLTDKESFNEISVWMSEVNKNLGNTDENKDGPIIYLIGNKLDKTDRVISREEAADKASFYGIKYFEISCKLNINVQEVYSRMMSECSENLDKISYISQTSFKVKVEKTRKKKKKKSLCC